MPKTSQSPPTINLPEGLREPDYALWGAKDLWTLSEAAALLTGWEPVPDEEIPAGPARERFSVIRDKLERDTGETTTCFQYTLEQGYLYYPWVVIEWAESSPVPFHEKLKTAVFEAWPSKFRTGAHIAERDRLRHRIAQLESELEKAKHTALPPYMKSEHTFFAPELEAAVSAWMGLFQDGRFDAALGSKEQLEFWLQEHRSRPLPTGDSFSDKAIGRIAAVATPRERKLGGRPRAANKT